MNVYPVTGMLDSPIPLDRPLRADLHEVGHNGDADFRGQLPVSLCLQWHIGHYAYLLDKLKATPEGTGWAFRLAPVLRALEQAERVSRQMQGTAGTPAG